MSLKNGYVRVLLFILPYFFVVGGFQLIAYEVLDINVTASFEDFKNEISSLQNLIISFFGLIGTVLITLFFRIKLDEKSFYSLGFQFKNTGKDILLGLGLGLLPMLLFFLLFLSIESIEIIEFNFIGLELFLVGLLFISVSFSEEILFRGYVLNNFMDSSNKYIALIISSLLFALMHGLNPNITTIGMFNLFLAGIMLGICYLFTQNLWFAFANHFSWNFFQAMFGFHVSGLTIYTPIKLKIESSIWTGGEFGIEGSVLTILLQIIIIVLLYFKYKEASPYGIAPRKNQTKKLQ